MSDSDRAKAAVLDTSFFGEGRFRVSSLRRLAAALAARGAELWIPEIVMLEFAVHAWEDLRAERQLHIRLRQAGLAEDQPIADLTSAQVADKLCKTCAGIPNVIVFGLTGEAAMAGLRDQILGTGPGSVKSGGVRTGAADSAWIRGALDRANDELRSIVFLSGNVADVRKTVEVLGHATTDMQILKPSGRATEEQKLDEFFGEATAPPPPVEPIDVVAVLGIVAASLHNDCEDARRADDRHGPPPEWIDIFDVSIGSDHDWGDEAEIETMIDPVAEVEPGSELVDVAVTDVYAAEEDGTGMMVDYTVRLLSDVRVEGQKIDNDGNGYWDWVILRDRLLTVPYTAELVDGALIDTVQTGPAENDTASPRFADNRDAYEWLYTDELSTWQHITIHPLGDDLDLPNMSDVTSTFELRGPGGRVEKAELVYPGDLIGDWTLEFEKTGASITSTYDHTARAALGRHDSFDVFPPASLSSSARRAGGSSPQPYAALAQVWAFLMGISEDGTRV